MAQSQHLTKATNSGQQVTPTTDSLHFWARCDVSCLDEFSCFLPYISNIAFKKQHLHRRPLQSILERNLTFCLPILGSIPVPLWNICGSPDKLPLKSTNTVHHFLISLDNFWFTFGHTSRTLQRFRESEGYHLCHRSPSASLHTSSIHTFARTEASVL